MAPSVKHGGFLVPNAAKASPGNPTSGVEWARMAEVDQIDFNTLSQTNKWSVLRGCQVTMAGNRASLINEGGELGLALIDGQLVEALPNTSAEVGPSQAQDRFDIIVLTSSGALKVVPGAPDFDPVLPEPGKDETILAAVFCPTSETSFSDCIIDKRVMAPTSLLTKVPTGEFLIRNIKDMSHNNFSVRGDGEMTWGIDTSVKRVDVGTLRVTENINLTGRFQANGDVIAQNLAARALVTGTNLTQGHTPVGNEPLGALRQAPDGRLYLNGPDGWVEMATIEATSPTGTIIQSVRTPDEMPGGWVQMNGTVINENQHKNLFTLEMLKRYIHTGPGAPAAPNRLMTLPSLTNQILIGTDTMPVSGAEFTGSPTITLLRQNLPAHNHNVQIGLAGGANPTGTIGEAGSHTHYQLPDPDGNPSGAHTHVAYSDPHKHDGMEYAGQNSRVIAEVWGGQNKIDGPFNDRNHTSSVEPLRWTAPATVEIHVERAGSGHTHLLSTQPHHTHPLNINGIPAHDHPVTQSDVGSGTPINVKQPSFFVFMYIKD